MCRGNEICALFFDYQKAFDSVPDRPLLNKLTALHVNPHLLHWVANYLTSRSQHVVAECEMSATAQVLSGVSHGSVLGPL